MGTQRRRDSIDEVNRALQFLVKGQVRPVDLTWEDSDDERIKELKRTVGSLVKSFADASEFISSLAQGRLDVEPPARNLLISPFKQLRSILLHLTWQTIQVANGDLNQRVDFLGEFSDAFNSMVDSLKEKRVVEERLRRTHEELVEANENILAAIQYAGTIQTALLPNIQVMDAELDEFFVLWRPKDVIGGDIYIFRVVSGGFLIAVIDCTGHSVPGAFMTMLAGAGFDRAVNEVGHTTPSLILKRMNMLMKNSLNQNLPDSPSDDGLDIGLCLVDREKRNLVFSGARISLFHTSGNTVKEIKGDRQSIGYKSSDVHYDYADHRIGLRSDGVFHMSMDGLLDQVGGKRGFSFGKRRLKEFLLQNAGLTMVQQKAALEIALEQFKGDEPQLDDITVLGFKV